MKALPALICLLATGGCATTQYESTPAGSIAIPPEARVGERIARAALNVIGTPYRYGGNTTEGFDCSGLVQYVHASVGIDVPRTSAAQYQSRPSPNALSIGDVVFFRIEGKVSHTGIYVGDGRFVHAPSSGKQVGVSRFDSPYFASRFVGARRFR